MHDLATLISSNAVPTTKDSALRFNITNGYIDTLEIICRYQVLLDSGELLDGEQVVNIANGDSVQTAALRLGDGQLISASVHDNSGTSQYGQVWADIRLIRDGGGAVSIEQLLASGYVYNLTALNWPSYSHKSPQEDTSAIHQYAGSPPGPGSEIFDNLSPAVYSKLVGMIINFNTDANVADRTLILEFRLDSQLAYTCRIPTKMTASQSYVICGLYGSDTVADSGNVFHFAIPDHLEAAGITVTSETANLQAGDDYANIRYFYRPYCGAGL